MKVTIGLVLSNSFPVPAAFVTGWTRVLHAILTGEGNRGLIEKDRITEARVIEAFTFPIDVARNQLCRVFLDEDDGDALLFLDADMVHPATIAHQLVSHGLPLVSGRYDMRRPPFHTVAMRRIGDGPHAYQAISKLMPLEGILPIDAAGAGALLIRRDVLMRIRARIGDKWFAYGVGEDGLQSVSEDMWFFEQAKAAGIQAWLDTSCYSRHIAQFEIDPAFQAAYLDAYRRQAEAVA